ncbi:MAG: hypothetical protein JST16_17355 [Bdellovibrionales bacterium]|nr:hypothetical protein [Bdellovibrionales bacterium]
MALTRLIIKDDPTWEIALEALAGQGNLSRFYKIPRHELSALMKIYGAKAVATLTQVFALSRSGGAEASVAFVKEIPEPIRLAMLAILVRSMKCWVETEAFNPSTARVLWKVAHS